jgi:hypothetical protein
MSIGIVLLGSLFIYIRHIPSYMFLNITISVGLLYAFIVIRIFQYKRLSSDPEILDDTIWMNS